MDITPEEDLITKERLAKGDLEVTINLKGKVNRAIPAQLTVMKDLVSRGVFPYHYEIYGVGFLELSAAFHAPWRVRNSVALLEKEALEQLGINVSSSRADEIYQHVCRGLGTLKIKHIQWVMEFQERRDARSKIEVLRERRKESEKIIEFKTCFERLIELMDYERERIFQENGC